MGVFRRTSKAAKVIVGSGLAVALGAFVTYMVTDLNTRKAFLERLRNVKSSDIEYIRIGDKVRSITVRDPALVASFADALRATTLWSPNHPMEIQRCRVEVVLQTSSPIELDIVSIKGSIRTAFIFNFEQLGDMYNVKGTYMNVPLLDWVENLGFL